MRSCRWVCAAPRDGQEAKRAMEAGGHGCRLRIRFSARRPGGRHGRETGDSRWVGSRGDPSGNSMPEGTCLIDVPRPPISSEIVPLPGSGRSDASGTLLPGHRSQGGSTQERRRAQPCATMARAAPQATELVRPGCPRRARDRDSAAHTFGVEGGRARRTDRSRRTAPREPRRRAQRHEGRSGTLTSHAHDTTGEQGGGSALSLEVP